MKRIQLLVPLAALGAALACHAAPISRCELPDGRVIYSDEPCPAGSQRTRTVDEKPAVEVIKSPADVRSDAKSGGTVRRSGENETASSDPEAASEIRKLKVAQCDDLVRRIEYAQHDLSAASDSERASAELALRRLQAEHEEKCALKRTPSH